MIDCHVNIWDEENLNDLFYKQIGLSRKGSVKSYKADADSLHQELVDIDKAIIFGVKYADSIGIETPDEVTAKAIEKYPEKFIGFCGLDPRRKDAAEQLEDSILRFKLRGVKVGPIYQKISLSDPRFDPIFKFCEKNNIPITMHMGTTFGRDCPIDYGRPLHVEPVAMKYPDLKLIMAHMGHPWEAECIAVIRKQPNVYSEVSALCYRPWQFYHSMMLAQEYGVCHKIFWGTDYPFSSVSESIQGLKNINQYTEGTSLPQVSQENIDRILNSNPLEYWWHK